VRTVVVAAGVSTLLFAACTQDPCGRFDVPEPADFQTVLLDPAGQAFQGPAPDTFDVRFETSRGDVVVRLFRDWAPVGADRFYHLARNGFFDGNRFFRVLPGFIVQFGVSGIPAVQAAWNQVELPDDPVRVSNGAGTLVYATAGPDTRTTQVFINYRDNPQLDASGFAPLGRVIEGMGSLRLLYAEYGETAPQGSGPLYACMLEGGNAYLDRRFERLDSIVRTTVTIPSGTTVSGAGTRTGDMAPWPPVATFSILGYDPATGAVGGAVQSRVFSVGNGVLWAEAGVGAVATQAIVDVSYGPQSLELLRHGLEPTDVVRRVWEADPDPRPERWSKEGRQFAVIDARGRNAAFTGPRATEWAGHRSCGAAGAYCTAQGNILAGAEVVDAMVRAFEETTGHLSFRLLAALEAGQAAGGDRRGMQSAAMLIAGEDQGVWLNNDIVLRLQVDDHPEPITELRRLVELAARQRR
jgi:peptidyl-prolyl cis-trans isomerase A (cyclophilin A)